MKLFRKAKLLERQAKMMEKSSSIDELLMGKNRAAENKFTYKKCFLETFVIGNRGATKF